VGHWWLSGRAVRLHLTLLVVVAACAALCLWQVDRALGGNGLSWAYVFEWPFFAGYAVYVWWKLLHDDEPEGGPAAAAGPAERPGTRDDLGEDDPDLAAYNRYLEELDATGRPKRW
jgi:DNA-binding transcriptional regulator of glucitol operon